jgi:hypothetical protein
MDAIQQLDRTLTAICAVNVRSSDAPKVRIAHPRRHQAQPHQPRSRRRKRFLPSVPTDHAAHPGRRRELHASDARSYPSDEDAARSASRSRSSIRRIFPVSVLGKSSTNSTRRGYA